MRIRWRGFELPTRVEKNDGSGLANYAKFHAEPFERGFALFGTTSHDLLSDFRM